MWGAVKFLAVFVQLDYIIGMLAFVMMSTWNECELPIGLDHRCVHCILTLLDTTQKAFNIEDLA